MDAVPHLLASGERDAAARLVEHRGEVLLKNGDFMLLLRWLDLFPDAFVQAHLPLCLLHAKALTLVGLHAAAEARLRDVERLLAEVSSASDERAASLMRDDFLAIQTLLITYRRREQWEEVKLALQVCERLAPERMYQRGVIGVGLGTAYMGLGEMQAAYDAFGEVVAIGEAVGLHHLVISIANRASLLVQRGRLRQAADAYHTAFQLGQSIHTLPAASMLYLGLGDLLREWNQLESARDHLRIGIELGKRWGFSGFLGLLYATLGRVTLTEGNLDGALALLEEGKQFAQLRHSGRIVVMMDAFRARFLASQGSLAALESWWQQYRDHFSGPFNPLQEREYAVLARVHLRRGAVEAALELALQLRARAEREGCVNNLIAYLVLLALIYQAQDDPPQALNMLARALSLAEPEGYLRVFLDEGSAIASLLARICERGYWEQSALGALVSPAYLELLLSHLEPKALNDARRIAREAACPAPILLPAVSARELDVLRLIAVGCSNREIAEQLVITTSTVKSYMNTLYSKLQVKSRTQAVARARRLQLLL